MVFQQQPLRVERGPAASEAEGFEEERALVTRAQRGERAAFDALVREHQRAVFAFAWRRIGNMEEARELTQQVFVRAYERIDAFRGDSRLRTWLLSIAVRLGIDAHRARARNQMLAAAHLGQVDELFAPLEQSDDRLMRRQAALRLRARVAELPEKQRLAVELRAFEELSFREVGEVLGISEDAAKVNYHHALRRLRTEMGTDQ